MPPVPPPSIAPEQEALLVDRLRVGIVAAEADRPDEAERVFREVLSTSRGSATAVERFACSCLVKIFARQNRDVEALVFARRAVVLAASRGDIEGRCLAYAGLGDALARIESWEQLAVLLDEFETTLAGYSGQFAARLRRCLLRLRADMALAHDDAAGASAELAVLAAVDATNPDGPEEARATLLFHVDIELRLGRPGAARDTLLQIATGWGPGGVDALDVEYLSVRCAAALDGHEAGAAAIAAMLDRIEAPDSARHGTAARIRYARLLGDLASAGRGDSALAARAYDVAATAVLARGVEIERATRELPELGAVDADDAAALADHRARFAAQQRELLDAVGRLLRARVASGDIPNWARESSSGSVAVCAWCLRVRLEDGSLVPLGHFLPTDSGVSVTHGMCTDCVATHLAALRTSAVAG